MIKRISSSKTNTNCPHYLLGLDLGPASVGWAVVECDRNGKPTGLLNCGVRRFDAGVKGSADEISSGGDKPRALDRRTARSQRRSLWRRRRRMRTLYLILARGGLLPLCEDCNESRHNALLELDGQLQSSFSDSHVDHHLLPYLLRAKALDEKLEPLELGRALYHLAQRRGYKSNRKTETSDEGRGEVATGISELEKAIDDSKSRTLGEYFSTIDPEEERIRERWTAREMFIDEFILIWDKQSQLQPELLPDELRQSVFAAIFNQRPLKPQKHLIGNCELEPTKRRTQLACLPAQRFRMLQRVNDLNIIAPTGEVSKPSSEQRTLLIETLQRDGDLSWADVRKLFKLTKKVNIGHREIDGKQKPIRKGHTFNFEEGGDKKIVGNRTAAKLRKHAADTWDQLDTAKQTELVDEILSFQSESALARRLENGWGLDAGQADAVSKTVLEQGYANHSRKAINRLLKHLEAGEQYSTIRRRLYPEQFQTVEALDRLPPVATAPGFDDIRNPSVMRTLTELRKVVNAIIHEYGKPLKIRIELARDLKHARKRREEFSKIRDRNEKARTDAAKKIVAEMKDESFVNRANILKVRLAEECGWNCPYSGEGINIRKLVESPQFEIEHIVPYSRSFDNSFVNKTLCHVKWNREKSNRTPYEAFGGREDYDQMLARVNRFQGGLSSRKLALFMRNELLPQNEFTNRMLNDTRYISRKACEYVGLLFGGVNDAAGVQRVQALPGRCTANLRNNWDLNRILGHPAKKERANHCHHAIDAIVIAVTSPGLVKQMSQAAETAEKRNTRMLFDPIDPPWKTFQSDIRQAIDQVVVSTRVDKRLNGSLHEATILSHPKEENLKGDAIHHVRKPIEALTASDLKNEAIADRVIRSIIEKTLKASGLPPNKAFADPANHPHLISKKDPSRVIPIHRVRIRKPDKPMAIGSGGGRRYVNPGSNHHMEIVAVLDADGNEKKWEGILVSRFDAITRKRTGQPVVQRNHGVGKQFKFSLAGTEHVKMDFDGTGENVYRVNVISKSSIEFILHSDARPETIRRKLKNVRVICTPNSMRKRGAAKVIVTPIGKVIPAND